MMFRFCCLFAQRASGARDALQSDHVGLILSNDIMHRASLRTQDYDWETGIADSRISRFPQTISRWPFSISWITSTTLSLTGVGIPSRFPAATIGPDCMSTSV